MQTVPTNPSPTFAPALALLHRSEAARQAMLVLLFGALTALSSQIQIPLYPVPVTAQVFVVLLAGALLGPRLGPMSQLAYLAFGFAGAPVFAGGKAGVAVLLGPTGGYLIGFPLAAWAAGWLAVRCRSFPALLGALLAASLLILLPGGLWLGVWTGMTAHHGQEAGLLYGMTHGVLPFLLMDTAKALLAACAAWPLVRRTG
jgi:biotin transport system substrate-specific component